MTAGGQRLASSLGGGSNGDSSSSGRSSDAGSATIVRHGHDDMGGLAQEPRHHWLPLVGVVFKRIKTHGPFFSHVNAELQHD